MNKVYQHGDELFVTLDATNRMRNLRTGLTIRVRHGFDKHFKYLGEMPQVGQVWLWESRGRTKRIVEIDGTTVHVIAQNGEKGTMPLVGLLRDHKLLTGPGIKQLVEDGYLVRPTNFIFATGHKDFLKSENTGRRFFTAARDQPIDTTVLTLEQAIDRFKQYCTADVEAEKQVRDHVGLYMFSDGTVWKLQRSYETCVLLSGVKGDVRTVRLPRFNAEYRALPLPGQLWAKGSRYVTVDRVEEGRVYYTGGSSGLRRFLNEYCPVATKQGVLVLDFAAVEKRVFSDLTFQRASEARPPVSPVQQFGRMLRPTPTDKPDPGLMSVISNRPIGTVASCTRTEKGLHIMLKVGRETEPPFRIDALEKLNSGTELEQLVKWARQLSLSVTKLAAGATHLKRQVRYAAKRVSQLRRVVK